jgi:hypothetical protein
VLDLVDPDVVVRRTEGVTASFLKDLLRRAALEAAERTAGHDGAAAASADPLRVIDADLSAALDQLLDTRSQVTRVLLGGRVPQGAGAAAGQRWSGLAGLAAGVVAGVVASHAGPVAAAG